MRRHLSPIIRLCLFAWLGGAVVFMSGCGKENPKPAPASNPPSAEKAALKPVETNVPPAFTNAPLAQPAPVTTNAAKVVEPMVDTPELANASYNLGVKHLKGDGVPQSISEAIKFFRKAAELNHPEGQHNLGVFYLSGHGVTKDYSEARNWLQKAADQGLAEARFKLASLYALGLGVPQDFKEAAQWVRKAADQGHSEAEYNLATLFVSGRGVEPSLEEAVAWYRRAAEKGKAAAQSNLGVFYASGKGVQQDLNEAVKWFRKAAEQGHPSAQYNLARSYSDGKVVEKNFIEAYKWFILAAGQGDKEAAKEQLELSLAMSSADIAEAIRRANATTSRIQNHQPAGNTNLLLLPKKTASLESQGQ